MHPGQPSTKHILLGTICPSNNPALDLKQANDISQLKISTIHFSQQSLGIFRSINSLLLILSFYCKIFREQLSASHAYRIRNEIITLQQVALRCTLKNQINSLRALKIQHVLLTRLFHSFPYGGLCILSVQWVIKQHD